MGNKVYTIYYFHILTQTKHHTSVYDRFYYSFNFLWIINYRDNPGQNHWLHSDIFATFDVPDCQFISNDPPRPQNNVESLPNALNMSVGHHSTLIGGGKGEGCLFCSDAHKIVASVVNVLTRIVWKLSKFNHTYIVCFVTPFSMFWDKEVDHNFFRAYNDVRYWISN
jgi:hypothetical protein